MNAEQTNPSWFTLGIEIVRLFPWFIGIIIFVAMARKIRKWKNSKAVRDVVDPTPKHEEDVKADVRGLLAEKWDAASVEAIIRVIDEGNTSNEVIAAKYPDLLQVDVLYEKVKGGKVQRKVEIAIGRRSGSTQVITATRTYDYDFIPSDIREEMIRKKSAKVAKLRYRAEEK